MSALASSIHNEKTFKADAATMKIIEQLQSWDADGDGELTLEEIVAGARKLVLEERKSGRLRRMFLLSVVVGILSSVVMFVITKVVVESSKEMKTAKSARLVDLDGVAISTAGATLQLGLADLTRLPVEAFKQVNKLTFRTDSGEHFTQVAFASKTANRLKITGQDGLKMYCTLNGCEVEFPDQRVEQIWVNQTTNGRFLDEHEFPTVDLAFAGYHSAEFEALVTAAVGHPGSFSLASPLGVVESGDCTSGAQSESLAAACGLEPSTLAVINEAAPCSDACTEAYAFVLEQCGIAGQDHATAGRRLAAVEMDARTASELLRYLARYTLERCRPMLAEDEASVSSSSWTSAITSSLGVSWTKEQPTALTLTSDGEPFLKQSIVGLRVLGSDGEALEGVAPLIFTRGNSYIESRSTTNADFVTVFSVLSLGPKSAFRVIISQVIAKAPHAFSHVTIGPTSVCVGRIVESSCMAKTLEVGQLKFSIFIEAIGSSYALPEGAAFLDLIMGVTSASSAQVVVVPAAHEDPSGPPSMGTLIMQRPDGSAIWKYRFDQTYNVDNAATLDTVVVRPAPQFAAEGAGLSGNEMLVAIRLGIGEGIALASAGSFMMYDPETFSGGEKISAATPAVLNDIRIDTIGIAAAALVYSKFDIHREDTAANEVKIGWLLENSKLMKLGGWRMLKYEGSHICLTDEDEAKSKDEYVCTNKGSKFGAAYGELNGAMAALIAFGGTDDTNDMKADVCAGIGGQVTTRYTKQVATGFWNAYNNIQPHFIQVLSDLKNLGVTGIMISGHSLGGAIASVATWEIYNSDVIASGYFKTRHLRTVTIGEPAAWNYPHIAFTKYSETTRRVSTGSGRRRLICSDSHRRRALIGACDQYWTDQVDGTLTPDEVMSQKYHRYALSTKQVSPQCKDWETGKWTFGIGATDILGYSCEQHDWDVFTGLPTLGGNGFHGTRGMYWIGFDAAKVAQGSHSEVINIYKESNAMMEYNEQFQSTEVSMSNLPGWLVDLVSKFTCRRRLSDASPPEQKPPAAPERRRLGLMERLGLHMGDLYFYWMTRGLCEELGAANCDCPVYCTAWHNVNEKRKTCNLGTSGYSVCGTSNVEHLCSDSLWTASQCNCPGILPMHVTPYCP